MFAPFHRRRRRHRHSLCTCAYVFDVGPTVRCGPIDKIIIDGKHEHKHALAYIIHTLLACALQAESIIGKAILVHHKPSTG